MSLVESLSSPQPSPKHRFEQDNLEREIVLLIEFLMEHNVERLCINVKAGDLIIAKSYCPHP